MHREILPALFVLLALTACAPAREAAGPADAPVVEAGKATADHGDNAAAPEYTKAAAADHARLDPRLRPDWTSRTFFPPEYCWHVVSMDPAHPLYWDIRKFCDKRRSRRTSR